ncbi:MAG TPA: UTP--glucose-1-phosphate uridylyltransferase [Hyphomicrobiales bacterium]|nr:UTP--glucose-1-phosphate uridylyltransferase [Hyphomicrobiales bacterium]
MSKPIRKAIFPVAGLGTRFLPATKAMPKEMLTVVDRPIIQHVFDEARTAGIEHFIFVTGRNKGVIEDHFDRQFELEEVLRRRNKQEELLNLEYQLPPPGATSFTRQQEPLGLGHAVWCARDIAGEDPFALLLPDVIVLPEGEGCLGQMIKVYNKLREKYGERAKINMIAVEEVAPNATSAYGVVGLEGEEDERLWRVKSMVEKPPAGTAPSNLIIMGRYILQPEIFNILKHQERGAGNEIQITDAMKTLMSEQMFFAYKYRGKSFDCGSKLGFLTANVAFALAQPDLASKFGEELKKLAAELQAKHR